MTTLVTGATGFVGQKIVERLPDCIVTSRSSGRARNVLGDALLHVIEWHPTSGPLPIDPELQISRVINLMGESIADGRWNAAKKKRIRDSRVDGTTHLVQGLQKLATPPAVMVSASAVGIYGSRGDQVVNEAMPPAKGFLPEICVEWETAANRATAMGTRVVLPRIGIVMGMEGGALPEMLPVFRKGLGGRLGNGKQWFPWIHVDDLVSLICWSLETDAVQGPVNATAPNPVTNAVFTESLAEAIGSAARLPVPRFAVKLALGEFGETLFDSQRVVPEKALQLGFNFEYPELGPCLSNLLQPEN